MRFLNTRDLREVRKLEIQNSKDHEKQRVGQQVLQQRYCSLCIVLGESRSLRLDDSFLRRLRCCRLHVFLMSEIVLVPLISPASF